MRTNENAARRAPGGRRTGDGDARSRVQLTTSRHGRQGPAHGRVIGTIWVKRVRKSAHMLYHPPAWAVDLDDLVAAERLGVRTLELREQEQGRVWRVSLTMFRQKGIPIDRGCGEQIALRLGCFRVDGGQPPTQPEPEPRGPVQVGLFSEVLL